MAQLVVRNIEAEVKERLVQRARRHGRSMEEEVRDILRNAVRELPKAPEEDFGTRFASFFEGLDMPQIEEIRGYKIEPLDLPDNDK
jgi:plasmid stability protein